MTTFPKKIVEKLQVVPGGVTSLVKKGESNFRPDVPPPQPPDNGYGDGFVFSTHNNDPVVGELPIMIMMVALDNSWKLVDVDTGILVADGLGNRVDGVEVQLSGAAEVLVTLSQTGSSDKKYRLTGNIMLMGIADLSQMSPPQPGPVAMSVSEGGVGRVIIHQWLARVMQYVFPLPNINLQVPIHLSPDIVAMHHMFAFCNLFNQDISTWDTSRVTIMSTMFMNATSFDQDISGWDVSNVTNMDSMFELASQFNQDLSPWCVRKIPSMPSGFDNRASRWVKLRPSWGTCPTNEVEPPYVPPVEEEVDDDTVIKAFDYALIRYRWTPTGGEDLDTRTYLSKPNRSGRRVGWNRLKNDNSYLIWNEDNTGSGVESVLIDIDKIHVDYPGEQNIELKMDGFWYRQAKSGKLDIEFATFKGGKMVASGYDWINEGGLAIQILKLGVDTLVQQSSNIEGENLATLHYDTLLKKGTLVARDGPSIGDGGTVEPEVPVTPPEEGGNGPGGIVDPSNPVYPDSEQGFTFSVEIRDNDGGSAPFDIRLVNVAPGWRVYSGNTLILSAEKIHPQVSANVAMGDVTLTFAIPRKDIKTYTIIAEARTLAFEITQNSYSGQKIAINRFSSTILNHQFSVTDADLTVPAVLPSYITSTFNMFLGANYFNQDISTWDTSRVTNMSGMFDNAETFNQDISGWDVSNVTNMMFMFRYAHKFNQPIGSWNVKNVTNMKSMFESAPAFNQDLSQWCVRKIATKPDRFDYSAHALYTSHLPVWGTCPDINGPVTDPNLIDVSGLGEPYLFNTSNVTDPSKEMVLDIQIYQYTSWQLVDLDSNKVIANSRGYFAPDIKDNQSQSDSADMQLARNKVGVSNYALYAGGSGVSFNNSYRGSDTVAKFNLTQWGTGTTSVAFMLGGTVTTVPNELSPSITSTSSMFSYNNLFNQDISEWNVSKVVSMDYMFSLATSFNQDLSGWDVSLIPVEPSNFALLANAWTLPKPKWGTTGTPPIDPTPGGSGTLKFSTRNIIVPNQRMKGSITLSGLSGEWQLLGGGNVLHSNVSTANVTNYTVYLTDWFAHEPIFEFIGTAGRVDIDLPNGFSGNNIIGEVIIESFSNTVAHQTINASLCILTVPETLPQCITSTNKMFRNCSEFNQDISMWDTSNVKDMSFMFAQAGKFNQDISSWDVGQVTNMNSMFDNAKRFNQDLSSWNVSLIPSEPNSFAYSVVGWTLPKPVWGTTGVAPLKSTFVAVDISGASGTFLTLSKNDGPWTTFNLADPGFDVAAFQSFVITGKDGSSFAFLDWPAPLKPEDANGSDKTPGIGGLVSPAGMVAPGHPDGYSFVDGVYVPPILLSTPVQTRKEINTLRIKQSAGAPAGYDIFFTIPGAVEGGILKVVSTVVFPFTDDDIYAPPL